MGTSPTPPPLPQNTYITMDYKYCKVWIRKIDKVEHMEEYSIYIQTEQEYQKYKQMFLTRIEHQYFPKTLYFIAGTTISCEGGERGSVLIERIPYRLCELTNIAPSESLSLIYFGLHGFRNLYAISGLFRIKTTMLGLDRKFRLKTWHHTDLSNPYPEDPYCESMVDMIESIIKSIESISRKSATKPKFRKYVKSRNICLFSFEIAIKMVEEYADEFGIRLANEFHAIRKYIREAEGTNTSNTNISCISRVSSSKNGEQSHHKTPSSRSNRNSKKSNHLIGMVEPRLNKLKTKKVNNNIYYQRTNEGEYSRSSIESSRSNTLSKNGSNKSSRQISESSRNSIRSNKENYADTINDPVRNCKPETDGVVSRSSLTSLENNSEEDSRSNLEKPSKIIERLNSRSPNQYESILRNSNITDQSYLPFTYLTSSNNNRNSCEQPYKQSNLRAGSTSAQSIPSYGSIEFGIFQSNIQHFGGLLRRS